MTAPQPLDRFLQLATSQKARRTGLLRGADKLHFELKNLFGDTDLRGRTVLDIGGGSGLCCFYAACLGASRAICVEPEAAGSTTGVRATFLRLQDALGLPAVELVPVPLETYAHQDAPFDVIVSKYSINHLDEQACADLLVREEARATYRAIASRIAALSASGGILIVRDCSNRNAFGDLGLPNPFAPSIDWHLHQAPQVWADVFGAVGFTNPRIEWTSIVGLGAVGQTLLGNRLMSYLSNSHFNLRMTRG